MFEYQKDKQSLTLVEKKYRCSRCCTPLVMTRYTWLDEGMGRLTMGLCLEQSSPLTTGPKPWEKYAKVFEKSEAEYIYSNFKNTNSG